jgi:hypothetical protein
MEVDGWAQLIPSIEEEFILMKLAVHYLLMSYWGRVAQTGLTTLSAVKSKSSSILRMGDSTSTTAITILYLTI